MAYDKQTWSSNDLITADKLNHIEDGIPTKTSQLENDRGFLTSHQSLADIGAVAKSGDTMTGKLTIQNENPELAIQNSNGKKIQLGVWSRTIGNSAIDELGIYSSLKNNEGNWLIKQDGTNSSVFLRYKPTDTNNKYATLELGYWGGTGNQGLYSYGYYDNDKNYQEDEAWLICRKNDGKVYIDGISLFKDPTARPLSSGTQTYDELPGLTSDHYVAYWRFSGGYSDNNPPADITVNTSNGQYTVTVTNLKEEGITMQPIFIR